MIKIAAIASMLLTFTACLAYSGGGSYGDPAIGRDELEQGAVEGDLESALTLARRLFFKENRSREDLKEAWYYFRLARDFIEPGHLRDCEFWLMHPSQDFGRAQRHCLKAISDENYYVYALLAYIYEHGPEGIRNPANAYSSYMLAAQVRAADFYTVTRAGQKRMGRELTRAERKKLDKKIRI